LEQAAKNRAKMSVLRKIFCFVIAPVIYQQSAGDG
jgi:hypothetical protein